MNGIVRIDIQRHGNCTNLNFGSNCQMKDTGRSISAVASTDNTRKAPQRWQRGWVPPGWLSSLCTAMAAMPVKKMIATAIVEAMKLKNVCSGSLEVVNRKFSDGSSPGERAWAILTQRCSYGAGRM